MSQRFLFFLILVLASTAIGLALFWQPEHVPGQAPGQTAAAGGDFVLHSADGPIDTRSLRGKVVLIYFGYTYCPDICPTTLVTIGEALKQLTPGERERVATVFVSVDPRRDTPQRLKDYTAFFDPGIIGVTGSDEEVAKVARLYGAVYARQDAGGEGSYVVDHSTWTYLVAADGHLAGRIAYGLPVAEVLNELRKWLPPSTPKGTS